MNALVTVTPSTNAEVYRASTDAAGLCRDIVLATAQTIQDRKYVRVEGWQAIAIAHGCTASARAVERVEGGVRAIGEVRRMSDGAVIAEAEGFVGEDEATWYGGTVRAWKWGQQRGEKVWYDKELPKRPDYAIRAMAQTRAISRACRSAFAHVVVLIDANLSTTPAEEVPAGGFDHVYADYEPVADAPKAADTTAAADFAIATMRTCKTPDEFKDFWNKNKDGLRSKLSDGEWVRVLKAKDEEVQRLTAPPADDEPTPFDEAA